MPKKARDGDDTAGLLRYLFGPGDEDEHVDPHLVAAWDPSLLATGRPAEVSDLAMLLDAPVHALLGRKPPLHVYHVAVRNPPEDQELSDAEWARVAREVMHAANVAPYGDDQGCRWLAVRHAVDHIHIAATRAREDGRQPDVSWDIVRMHEAARRFEVEFGLRRLAHGDGTANRWPKTGEAEKARRQGLAEPPRATLQRAVREAAAMAGCDADFFAGLTAAGLRVKQRVAPEGGTTGYAVALPGDRDGRQTPVWFPGTRLAPDLSLPRVRERWSGPEVTVPGEGWRAAEEYVRAAGGVLGAGGVRDGAGDVAALGDLLVVAAAVSPSMVRDRMREAAAAFERAARAPGVRGWEGRACGRYRSAAQVLGRAAGREDTPGAHGFLLALGAAVGESGRWHEAQEHSVQVEAAGRAGRLLREAVEVLAGAEAARAHGRVVRRAPATAGFPLLTGVVQRAVPQHAREVLADPVWPVLRERLAELEKTGEHAGEVLAAVVAGRGLGSADRTDKAGRAESPAEVLVWRLDGWRRQRDAAARSGTGTAAPRSVGTSRTGAPYRRPPGEQQVTKSPKSAR